MFPLLEQELERLAAASMHEASTLHSTVVAREVRLFPSIDDVLFQRRIANFL